MENIEYYKDLDNDFLLAYEKTTEFFVRYVPKTTEWEYCNISFSNFRHDYRFEKISTEEAIKITNGSLPDLLYSQYSELLRKNRGN